MSFFSRRVTVSAGTTKEVLSVPSGVKLRCLAIRVSGDDAIISCHAQATTTGFTLIDGESVVFSDGDLDCVQNLEKRLWVYSASDITVEIFGTLEIIGFGVPNENQ